MRGRSPGWAVASLAIIGALTGCGGGALAGQASTSTAASAAPVATQTPVVVTQTVVVTDTVTVTVSAGVSSALAGSASASSGGVSSTGAAPATTSASETAASAATATTFTPHATPTSQPGGLAVADATQVVLAFLGSLEKNPSGASSMQYLSQQLKAQVQAGRPIPSLLGVQNLYSAYHVDAAVSRAGGRAATVRATLTYASGPVQRLFTLVPENGSWKIDDIADSNA